jgi:hypothetical protein
VDPQTYEPSSTEVEEAQISLRLPVPLRRALEEQAALSERTISGEIRVAIRRHVGDSLLADRERYAA